MEKRDDPENCPVWWSAMEKIIHLLNINNIRYVIIGGQAIRLLGMPRLTMDWDIFIPHKDAENLRLLNDVLEEFLDMPIVPLGPKGELFIQTYQTPFGVLQFHLLLPGLSSFDDIERRSTIISEIRCISAPDLLLCKKTANRHQDQDDIEYLENLQGV
ncbi:hypothetical protein ACFL27_05525 [candidate division CSSED10-310 bacterium]|uniref:Nucleotidyl transferase AbiEii/AbiGii toxin family protein n=1 Tax=candidate division CSSED10-310 bacterium TaxID=2855610 RepID=A0ABV6YTX6_UNCC1